ncbi:hypothetical protein [Clostridium sp.]|uniref:hypothetical protein n=1 Tax=Clostridium sp. TaxID=1506 RepID=UPI0026032D34|nr:hypothetical protein [uncultured Clostridium sp.]
MKVLVISGSPRIGGNSYVLCDQFIEGAKEAVHRPRKLTLVRKSLVLVQLVMLVEMLVSVFRKMI